MGWRIQSADCIFETPPCEIKTIRGTTSEPNKEHLAQPSEGLLWTTWEPSYGRLNAGHFVTISLRQIAGTSYFSVIIVKKKCQYRKCSTKKMSKRKSRPTSDWTRICCVWSGHLTTGNVTALNNPFWQFVSHETQQGAQRRAHSIVLAKKDFSPMFTFHTSGTVYHMQMVELPVAWMSLVSSDFVFLYLDFSVSQWVLSCLPLCRRTLGWLLYSVLSFSHALSLAPFG